MSGIQTSDLRIVRYDLLVPPIYAKEMVPVDDEIKVIVQAGRKNLGDILDMKDDRIFVIAGPCSVHDIEEAKEYGNLLLDLAQRVNDKMVLVMRVYTHKPRTNLVAMQAPIFKTAITEHRPERRGEDERNPRPRRRPDNSQTTETPPRSGP